MAGLAFDVLARDKASKTFDNVGKAAERTEKKFGFLAARTGGLAAGMTAGFGKIAGAMVAVASVQVFKGFIDEARESRKVGALTEQIIKSTGGAAKVSAKQVGELATAISNKTGVDDEAVQSGANLLLTFKNVRNEVGKGANIFDRATAAAVDLSAAGFGEVSATSKMLGKALNDPLKGLTALGKAGVTFTEDQKKQIKTLVETGKTLEAQKIILQEVESQVGGAAAAAADPMAKLGVILGNVKETIGTAFLPAIDKVATFLGDKIPGAVGKAATGFKALKAAFQEGDVTSDGFVGVMERIGVAAGQAFDVFRTVALPRLREFGSFVSEKLVPSLGDFLGFITKWPARVILALKTGFDTGNWAPLGKAIGNGLVTALKGAGELVGDVLDAIGGLIDRVDWAQLGSRISAGLQSMARNVDWKKVGDTLGDAVISIVEKATTLAQKLGTAFKNLMNKVDWNTVGRESTDAIGRFISGIDWGRLARILGTALLKSLKINVDIRNTIVNSATDLVEGIAVSIGQAIGRWFSDAGSWLAGKGKELVGGLKSGASTESKSLGRWITSNTVTPLVGAFKDAGKWLVTRGRELVTGLKNGISDFTKGLDSWIMRAPVATLLKPWYNAGKWLVRHGANFLSGFVNGISSFARGVPGWLMRNVVTPTVGAFSRAGTWLIRHGSNLIAGFTSGVTGFMRAIGSIGGWMYNKVIVPAVKVFGQAGSWLGRAGRDLIGGLVGGIATRMKGIGGWIKSNVVDPVVTATKKFFGIKSPSTVFAGIGFNLVAGLIKGLAKTNGRQIATKVFGDMPSALQSMVGKGLVGLSGLPQKALDALGFGANLTIPGVIPGALSGPNRRVFYQGEALDLGTYNKLAKAMQMVGAINVTQGSYERASSYSGSTHTGGGVFDVVGGNLSRIMSGLKASGLVGWIRNPSQGPWPWHIHALDPAQAGRMSASARAQVADYYRGGDGLAGYKQGTPWVPNDQWAFLHQGEGVMPRKVNEARIAASRNSGGSTVGLTLSVAPGGDSALAQVIHKLVRTGVIQLSVGGQPVRVVGA